MVSTSASVVPFLLGMGVEDTIVCAHGSTLVLASKGTYGMLGGVATLLIAGLLSKYGFEYVSKR